MNVTNEYARISHHTLSLSVNPFTVPASSDFTDGTWTMYDLDISEIGTMEDVPQAHIRIDSSILQIPLVSGPGTATQILTSNGDGTFSWSDECCDAVIYEAGSAGTGSIKPILNGDATGNYATMSGGLDNIVTADYGTISGGKENTVSGLYSGIIAGEQNTVGGEHTFLGAGEQNIASGDYSFIGGGSLNTTSTIHTFVGGGTTNDASNNFSLVVGGSTNTASAQYSSILGGLNHTASGTYGSIGGGTGNTASAIYTTVGGGRTNVASASDATVSGGTTNTASATSATVVGGASAKANRYGQRAYAAGQFSTQGDSQQVDFVARTNTTDATATNLWLDGNSARLTIPSGNILAVTVNVAGIEDDGTEAAHYMRKVMIKNVGGTTSLVGAVQTISTDVETSAGLDVTITADDTNDALDIKVTGLAATDMRWVCHVSGVEIIY